MNCEVCNKAIADPRDWSRQVCRDKRCINAKEAGLMFAKLLLRVVETLAPKHEDQR